MWVTDLACALCGRPWGTCAQAFDCTSFMHGGRGCQIFGADLSLQKAALQVQ